ncbi:MAG: methyltransferase [Nanoarchaeota archaeon]|nr:methyltransferase [Nanoarchaeota archaeon]
MTSLYTPREDSFLLKKYIKNHVNQDDSVLDLGTGTGILAKEAQKYTKNILAADIDPKAIRHCKTQELSAVQSDLFSNITGKFNLIIFNPPYLPKDKHEPSNSALQTTGGKQGYELIEKFLTQAKHHLKPKGKILLLFSSLTNKTKIDNLLKQHHYTRTLLETKPLFFEKLYLYLIKPI